MEVSLYYSLLNDKINNTRCTFRIVEFVLTFLFSVWVHLGLLRPLTVVPRLVKSYQFLRIGHEHLRVSYHPWKAFPLMELAVSEFIFYSSLISPESKIR